MPNWVEGCLKLRGKSKNMKRFILDGLIPVDYLGNQVCELREASDGIISTDCTCWIKGTKRGFVEKFILYIEDGDEIQLFNAKFAWDIRTEQLAEISKKYGVDFKFYGYERGMEFNRDIEIINGEITKDETIEFDDYSWECDNPMIGG